jgi:hypothetical protein
MPTIRFTTDTDVPADEFVGALTDFGPDRPKTWPNLDPSRYRVHALCPPTADVTEGSSFAGGIWERGTYNWSEPGVVRFTVSDSNPFAPGSYWEYRVAELDGHTRIEVVVRRRPRTFKARVLSAILLVFGRRVFRKDLERTLAILRRDKKESVA